MSSNKTIENLQVGDSVVIGHRRGPMTVEVITKVTKTQITTDAGRRYSKRTGDVIDGDSFHAQHYLKRDYRLIHYGLMSIEYMEELNAQAAKEEEERNTIKDLYLRGRYSANEAKRQLANLGYPKSYQDMYLNTWDAESQL